MNPTLDLSGGDRKADKYRRFHLATADATTLMFTWMKYLDEGNKRGVLAGLDGKGNALVPVTYRPKLGAIKITANQRNTSNNRAKRGAFQGYGPQAAGLHGNLGSSEYRRLAGPPLAPRGPFSRAITNFMVDFAKLREALWQVTYWWQDVVSRKGVSFLRFHFDGDGRLPRRDLRGIRPADREKCRAAKVAWMADAVRSA